MRVVIEEPGEILNEAQLRSFEGELGTALPSAYRAFLLRNNGGIPTPEAIEIVGAAWSPTDVQVLFGIGRVVDSSNLRWNRRTFAARLPERMLPIACDSGGNLFCISLAAADEGSVSYFDLESHEPKCYFVAADFDDFLERLA